MRNQTHLIDLRILFLCGLIVSFSLFPAITLSEPNEGSLHLDIFEPPDLEPFFKEKGLRTDFDSLTEMAQNHSELLVRLSALDLLEERFGKERTDEIIEVFLKVAENDSDFDIKNRAAQGLHRLGDKKAVALLKRLATRIDDPVMKNWNAYYLSEWGDLSGFKYILESRGSKYTSERYYSAILMSGFFKYRSEIQQDYQVDILEEFLKFGHDPYPAIRSYFIRRWPYQEAPEKLNVKYREAIEKLAENDLDSVVRVSAQLRRDSLADTLKNKSPK